MIKEHDVVALKTDLPKHGLKRSDIGAAVVVYPDGAMEVEFVTFGGDTVALVHLHPEQVRSVGKKELPQARPVGIRKTIRRTKALTERHPGKKLRAG